MFINQQEFRDLHDQYQKRLVKSITAFAGNRDEAEDITASAFEKRSNFRGDALLHTWVHAITLNEIKSRRRLKRVVSLDALNEMCPTKLAESGSFMHVLEKSECMAQLRAALAAIPTIYRRALVDHIVCRHSVKTMAKRQRLPVGTVLSRIFTAKQALRKAWEGGS